jgi:uncharacterized protein with HEPN domain
MSRDALLYLEDMQEACEKVLRYTKGATYTSFTSDEKTFDAVVRNLEIIGEAAKHVPPEVRERYPTVAWTRIAGLRDMIAHAYFGLDDEILWDIVQNRIPELLQQVTTILSIEEDAPAQER